MSQTAIQALEFPALLAILKRYLSSPLGEWRLEEFAAQPLEPSQQAAETALAEVSEALSWLHQAEADESRRNASAQPSFRGLQDTRGAARRLCVEGTVLEGHEIHALLELLDRAETMRLRLVQQTGRRPHLAVYGERLADFRPLLRELSGKVLPNGELADDASPALNRIRRHIEQHRRAVHKLLEQFVRRHYEQGLLQEDYVTIRNGRLVVPVKTTWKSRIEGVIHSTSSTGQTVFVEPLETIELNNGLARLIEEKQIEAHRILREMTSRLRADADAIGTAIETLAHLEFRFAQAQFGKEFRCCIPSFSSQQEFALRLVGARHPLLDDVLRGQGPPIVPLSLSFDAENRVLVLSGPNAGGKTVVLKTAGLLALMAQAGLPVPAEEAVFPWFGEILADIGDSQSITESLSTFSAHIQQIRKMLESAGARSLVLLDELGAATDPEEGGALAVAIVDHFLRLGAVTIVSTHLPALKTFAANTPGARNAAMGFDEESLAPNYRLHAGIPGQSAGLAMARRFGMPESVISRARQVISKQAEQTGELLRRLHRQVEEHEAAAKRLKHAEHKLEERERRLAQQWERREQAKLRELEERIGRLLQRFEQEHQTALEKLEQSAAQNRAVAEAKRLAGKRRRETREELQDAAEGARGRGEETPAPPPATAALEEGAIVRLAGLGVAGKLVRKLSAAEWEVEAGRLKMRVDAQDITEILTPPEPRPAGRVTYHSASIDDFVAEINVIGSTSEEARDAVDKFLDEAVLAEAGRVRVIHGHGMNVLRRTLWRMFTSHPHVARYYQAEPYEGGAGATIVEVKL